MSEIKKLCYIAVITNCLFRQYCFGALANSFGISSDEPLPKPVTYFTLPSSEENEIPNVVNSTDKYQEARFNHINAGAGSVEPIPSNLLTAGFYPLKIDVGGLLLGAIVGLGALVIVPKLVHLLSNEFIGYGHYHGSPYKRYDNGIPESVSRIASQVEDILEKSHINSTVCVQKAICSYTQSVLNKLPFNSGNGIDQIFKRFLRNRAISFLIDGSKFKSAVEEGINGTDCKDLYSECPFTQENITNGIKRMMSSNKMFDAEKYENLHNNRNRNRINNNV